MGFEPSAPSALDRLRPLFFLVTISTLYMKMFAISSSMIMILLIFCDPFFFLSRLDHAHFLTATTAQTCRVHAESTSWFCFLQAYCLFSAGLGTGKAGWVGDCLSCGFGFLFFVKGRFWGVAYGYDYGYGYGYGVWIYGHGHA